LGEQEEKKEEEEEITLILYLSIFISPRA